MNSPLPGTIIVYGPVFARSGFGLLARGWAMALHAAGAKVKIVPVDCNDPNATGGLDDCDSYLLRSLQYTPVTTPVTAIFAYVPIYVWPKAPLPEPHVRIMLTTFDSTANAASPPYRLVFMCNQMDQVWVANAAEERAWVRAGLEPHRLRWFNWPHEWIDSTVLPPAAPKPAPGRPFRFLHTSLFLPRRRLDVLLRAFFEEFPAPDQAELYLKMTYPTWHPVAGKPKRDLRELIDRLRALTGSRAPVTLDESLGTRLDMVRVIDSCDAYVSPDTTNTAPVSEAIIRQRPVIITDGWGVDLPPQALTVPNSQERIQLTPEMAAYMPHQRGASFPALDVGALRAALRQCYDVPPEARRDLVQAATQYMRERYSYAATAPAAIKAIQEAWAHKSQAPRISEASPAPARTAPSYPQAAKPKNIIWCGLQLFYGKVPSQNRGWCLELIRRGHQVSLRPSNGPFQIEELPLEARPEYQELADRFFAPLRGAADVNVCSRWHPIFREEPAAKQVMVNTWGPGAIPVDWVRNIDQSVDEVWVPSRHVRDNFLLGGVPESKLWVMPAGVDPLLFRPEVPPWPLKTRKCFKFLFVGETSPRKGLDWLLQAYGSAFSRKDDVCLVIKDIDCEDYYWRRASADLIRKFQDNRGFPEIEYLDSMLPEKDLPSLYAACDCFVQPFRAASLPLAVLEAMACGMPVITTGYGGALDLCDDRVSYLLPAREAQTQQDFVGHWRVTGPQRHAEINLAQLRERMRHVVAHQGEARKIGGAAREKVCAQFDVKKQVETLEARLAGVCQQPAPARLPISISGAPAQAAPPPRPGGALRWLGLKQSFGSVLFVAPFYNRSGYGTGARSIVACLQAAGVPVRIVPVDNVEPGINDCDMAALKALEHTPLTLPVAAIFFHVPQPLWLKIPLPEQSIRILYTTFDSSAQGNQPPAAWIEICKQMDQVWLMTKSEAEVFASAGVPAHKIQVVWCPHPWVNNSRLPLPLTAEESPARFRFLSLAMFLPRRRWDTLIEAFLSEFRNGEPVELYLKVNYPSWHPVPGQPRRDLHQLIQSLRQKTGSTASIILDEELGTRLDICRLMDSCQAYVSTDTSSTAPLGEALVRGRMAIIPDGYGVNLPSCDSMLIIPADPALKTPMTPEMLLYQPHHRGKDMPLLRVEDVRCALRSAFEIPPDRRASMGRLASLFMEASFGPNYLTPIIFDALRNGFAQKAKTPRPTHAPAPKATSLSLQPSGPVSVRWEGSFLDLGSLSQVNRELTSQLACRPEVQMTRRSNASELPTNIRPEFHDLAAELQRPAPLAIQVTVRHAWPPDWRRPATGKLVVIQPWEYGALPLDWVANSGQVDEFWLPSNYVRDVYVKSGVPAEKVKVVPNGVDPDRFHPAVAPMNLATKKGFKFLFVGGTIHRKGADALLQAYLQTFTAQDDVCLVIKDFGSQSFYTGQTLDKVIQEASQRTGAPEILYLTEEFAPESIPGLYTACDCLVHPYRGEGFGLPILEAMACGLPVMVTAGGAADDFAGEEFAYPIPSTQKLIGDTISGMKLTERGWLLEPDATALAARMNWVVENREAARAKGRHASQHARQAWTWAHAARIAADRLQQLAAATPRSLARRSEAKTATPHGPPPPCALLGQLAPARQLLGNKKPREAWSAALAAIACRPYHPEAYLLLAEIAEFAGDGQAARACADHAHRLAPGWKPARQFLKRPLKGNTRPDWLALPATLPGAAQRPISPKPDEGGREDGHAPRLTICLIAKNEEQFLGQCLNSVKGLADQIVLVDTGSTDRTVEVAKEHGAEIHHFKWCDDFSAARNAALEAARGEWVLMLDADEELPADQHARLRADMKNGRILAFRLPLINRGQENEGHSFVPRLFRNLPGAHYTGCIHEQVFPSLLPLCKSWELPTGLGTAQILHHGYTKGMVKDRNKIARNLALLRRAVEENPEDPNLVMNLGLELVRSDDLNAGIEYYRQAFDLMSEWPSADIVPELREVLLTQFTCHLYKIRAHHEVVSVLSSPLAKKGGLTASLHFALGLAQFELKNYAEAADQMRQCLAKRRQPALAPINIDILSAGPSHCLAMCLARQGDASGAESAFQAGLSEQGRVDDLKLEYSRFLVEQNRPVEALQRLREVVSANTANSNAWRLGGQIALSRPEFLKVARDWTAEAARCLPEDATIAEQRGEAMLLNGDLAGAREVWQRSWSDSHQPQALAGMVFCDIAGGQPPSAPQTESEDLAASRAFIALYQKCLAAHARGLITRVNERVDLLHSALPTAASMIQAALSEAERPAEPACAR